MRAVWGRGDAGSKLGMDHPEHFHQFIMLGGDGVGRGPIPASPVVDGLQALVRLTQIPGDLGSGMTAPAGSGVDVELGFLEHLRKLAAHRAVPFVLVRNCAPD